MVDARNFKRNTDYPTDQIVGFLSGNLTVANGTFPSVDVPHPLGVKVLPVASWSPTAAFDISYPAVIDLNGSSRLPAVTIQANENVARVFVGNQTGSTVTVHWRVFFLLPSNVNPDVTPTAIQSLPLTYSTDYNYPKLVKEDYLTSSTPYTHGLGYRPQVSLWGQHPNGFIEEFQVSDTRTSPAGSVAEVSTTQLAVTLGSYVGVHFRLYGDAA